MDIGGGSVEIVLAEKDRPPELHSLKLGVARVSEEFFAHDPPRAKEVARLEAFLRAELEPALATAARRRVKRVIGTSGTALSLISMAAHQLGCPPRHAGSRAGRPSRGRSRDSGEASSAPTATDASP